MEIVELQRAIRDFAAARDWEQFHNPKNLVMALTGEVGELAALFQWLDAAESEQLARQEPGRAQVQDELADVAIYLLRLADIVGVDLRIAIESKLDRNEDRYPADRVRGSTRKYDEL